MSTTIDSLDIQISTSLGQSEQKLRNLASALGELKNQGKITEATKAMKQLAKALDVMNPALDALNPAKLQQLRAAMSGLSGIQKASGLSNTVNTLKKLPTVLNSLDDTTLAKLEAQVNRLAKALGPLATQIDKIGTGFSKLPKYVSKTVTLTNQAAKAHKNAAAATKEHGNAINATTHNIFTLVQNLESMLHVANVVWNGLTATFAQAMEWDGIQYRFGRAFGEDAEEVYAHVQRINEVMGIGVQQFMQYSSLYGSLLSGFGMAQEKVTTISVGLTELSYDIWAAYNDRFKSLEDASEAVRSAITGEIEPIRNAGIALTEASLQEYLDGVGMAQVSIENLSEAQKAEVRYAAMVNAAMNQGIVGTYASEMETAEGAVRSLSQSFTSLVQAFGSLFIPILQAAIPYLTAFVNLLRDAVAAIADFFGIAFFEIDWDNDMASDLGAAATEAAGVSTGLGNAAKAAKKIKDYTMGFDELNIIQPPDESSRGGGGAGGSGVDWGDGLDLKTLWDNSIFDKASQQVNTLKQQIKGWFEEWKTQIAIVAGALAALSIASLLTSLGEAMGLGDKFLGVMGTIKKLASTAIVITLQYTLMSEFFSNFIEEGSWKDYLMAMVVGAIGTGILYSMWGPTGLVIGLGVTAVASFKAVFENGGITDAESATVALTGLASGIGAIALAWNLLKDTDFGMFFRLIKEGYPAIDSFAAAFPGISGAFSTVSGAISSAATAVGGFLSGISAPVWGIIAGVIAGIASVALFLSRNWEAVTTAAKNFFDQNIAPKLELIKGHWDDIVEALEPVIGLLEWLIEPIVSLAEGFAEWWEAAEPLSELGDMFEAIGGVIYAVISGVIAGAFNMFVGMIENAMQVFSGIVEIVGGVIDLVVAVFTGGDIGEAWGKIWDGVVDVVSGLWDLVTKPIEDFVDGIIGWFVELWDELVGHSIVPDTIDAIVEWFLSLPDKIFKPVQDFVDGIVEKFEAMWSDLKSWFNDNVAPKLKLSYWKKKFSNVAKAIEEKWDEAKKWWDEKKPLATVKASVASIKDKLKSAWDKAKTWWTEKKPDLSSVKTTIASIKEKLSAAWDKARTWWKEKKPDLSTVKTAVASIKDKLSGAWTTAREWWNSKKPSLDKVQASIASIKEKLSTAWTTAKDWWNNSKSKLSSVSFSVDSIKSKIESAWKTAKDWLAKQSMKLNIKMPTISVGWNYNIPDWQATIAEFLFDKRAMPKLNVNWYANGGFPGMGEMFVAREAGPELVGKIGNRNAVVNNDQIVEAVSRGVYEAVAAAMGSYSGSQSDQAINVYLDGKQITAVVEKRQRERGATLMTGGMAYGY